MDRIAYHISMKTRVSERGQVTSEDPLESVTGVLKLGRTTDELLDELRGEPDAT